MRFNAIAASILSACVCVHAAQASHRIGSFIVKSEEVKFGDGAGMSAWEVDGRSSLLIYCVKETLTVTLGNSRNHFSPGERFSIQFRADNKPIVKSKGTMPEETPEERAFAILRENSDSGLRRQHGLFSSKIRSPS